MITAPLKAPSAPLTDKQLQSLSFPVLASLKKDGIRALTHPDLGLVSQRFKLIPNDWVRNLINMLNCSYLDGELFVPGASFNENQSVIMSRRHPRQCEVVFACFDDWTCPEWPYQHRLAILQSKLKRHRLQSVLQELPQVPCQNYLELCAFEELAVQAGEEGVMVRSPAGHYKSGRSTLREALLLKMVRHVRDEATITGFVEQQSNCNQPTTNALGHQVRSKHQANMFGNGVLGAFVCDWHGHELRVGTGLGLTLDLRTHIWQNQAKFIGKTITFKFKPFGQLTLPRAPIWMGFRED